MIWLNRYTFRLSSDLWLDIKSLQLYKTVFLEYVKKISGIRYGIENYVIIKPNVRLKIEL